MLIQLIENRSEIGAGTRGASLGVDALRISSLNKKSSYFNDHDLLTIKDENHLLFEKEISPNAKRIKGIRKVYNNIAVTVADILSEKKFPLVLSADHASAGGTIAGLKKHCPNKRLGVIWIDAHADLHSPYTSPTGNIHGMPLATALNEDNKECQIRELDEETVEDWNYLKNCAGISPKVLASDIVFFGVRDTEQPEDELIERKEIKNFKVDECRTKGIENACKEAISLLNDCDYIYISFDVDSMDCDPCIFRHRNTCSKWLYSKRSNINY